MNIRKFFRWLFSRRYRNELRARPDYPMAFACASIWVFAMLSFIGLAYILFYL